MDLNYLFFRQQVERSREEGAEHDAARRAHAELARIYEVTIAEATGRKGLFRDR